MAASWQSVGLEYLVDGRRVPVSSLKYGQSGSWVDVSSLKVGVDDTVPDPDPDPTPTGLPAAPAGYTSWYEVDFRNIGTQLPAGWTAQARSGGNSAGTYRAQNLAVVPGTGLVHTAERASVGSTIYTGGAWAKGLAIPQFCHVRFAARVEGLKRGTWPSFWMRPTEGHGWEGEKDQLEVFAGHIYPYQGNGSRVFGGGFITTPYPQSGSAPSAHWNYDSALGIPSDNDISGVTGLESTHVYETQQVSGSCKAWIDKQLVGTITAANMSTAAGRAAWPAQFDDPTHTWYPRTDFQISGTGTQAGVSNAGPLSADQVGKFARWVIEWVQIFTPVP